MRVLKASKSEPEPHNLTTKALKYYSAFVGKFMTGRVPVPKERKVDLSRFIHGPRRYKTTGNDRKQQNIPDTTGNDRK
jgi:hypothetical protein